MSRTTLVLICAAAMAGCAGITKQPAVIEMPIVRYVPIPADLTTPCKIAQPQSDTVAEAVRVARLRRDALEKCNADKAQISALQGTAQ
jgi:hypothetical protein